MTFCEDRNDLLALAGALEASARGCGREDIALKVCAIAERLRNQGSEVAALRSRVRFLERALRDTLPDDLMRAFAERSS